LNADILGTIFALYLLQGPLTIISRWFPVEQKLADPAIYVWCIKVKL